MSLLYWSSTLLVSGFLCWSAYAYVFSASMIEGVRAIGLPDFLRIELAVLKVLAVLAILIPVVPMPVKEWAYAGAALFFITALVAHMAHKDPLGISLINVVLLGLLVASYVGLHQL